MFTDFRDDDTQNLFTKALDGFGKFSFYGFKNNGIIILTSDFRLLEILANMEQQEINNTPKNKKKRKIEMLNFGDFKLDRNQKLSTTYSNALYFIQGTYTNGCGYGAGEIGGEKTLILADSPTKLKKFINPIFKKHFLDFNIDLYSSSLFADPTEPLLKAELVVDNNRLTLNNDGNYCSRLLFRSATDDICSAIDKAGKQKLQDNVSKE